MYDNAMETLPATTKTEQQIQKTEMQALRRIYEKGRRNMIPNEKSD